MLRYVEFCTVLLFFKIFRKGEKSIFKDMLPAFFSDDLDETDGNSGDPSNGFVRSLAYVTSSSADNRAFVLEELLMSRQPTGGDAPWKFVGWGDVTAAVSEGISQ